jgi:TRAP-type mannitol/chloroaromatic compound transport system permease small subunit
VTFGVTKRYLFASPSIVAIELVKILLIPACVLAVPYVQRYDRHLKVDFLFNRFSKIAQQILLEIFLPVTGLFVGYVLVWKGWVAMAYSLQIHETSFAIWAEPLWPVRLVIPIGYGLLCLVMVGQLCRGIGKLIIGRKKVEPMNPDKLESS